MAWGTGAAIGLISVEPAAKTLNLVRSIVGDGWQITVLQIGYDQAAFGTNAQNDFLTHMQWLQVKKT